MVTVHIQRGRRLRASDENYILLKQLTNTGDDWASLSLSLSQLTVSLCVRVCRLHLLFVIRKKKPHKHTHTQAPAHSARPVQQQVIEYNRIDTGIHQRMRNTHTHTHTRLNRVCLGRKEKVRCVVPVVSWGTNSYHSLLPPYSLWIFYQCEYSVSVNIPLVWIFYQCEYSVSLCVSVWIFTSIVTQQ